MYLQIMYYTFF